MTSKAKHNDPTAGRLQNVSNCFDVVSYNRSYWFTNYEANSEPVMRLEFKGFTTFQILH